MNIINEKGKTILIWDKFKFGFDKVEFSINSHSY